jgi:glycosyltransferase involved in cell wall biosynthesis
VNVALLTEIPAPYRLPLFRALAREEGIELRVLYLARSDPRRSYEFPAAEAGFEWEVLPGRGAVRGGRWLVFNRGVLSALRRLDPALLVVGGWNQPAYWQALAYARARRRPLVTWVESTARDSRFSSPVGRALRHAFVRGSAAFLVPGRAAAAYVRSLGVEEARIAVAPNAVDPVRFGQRPGQAPASGRDRHVRLLYVGRLSREKGLDVLFRAVADMAVQVAVVGTGPERKWVESEAPPNVVFLGQLDQEGVAAQYAEADVFVLPSRSEPWGMVLNEAAAAGLPLVATEAAGAAHDLIEDGVNGFRVPPGDPAALREALIRLTADPELRARAGERSRELAAGFTPEAWAGAVAGLARRLAG